VWATAIPSRPYEHRFVRFVYKRIHILYYYYFIYYKRAQLFGGQQQDCLIESLHTTVWTKIHTGYVGNKLDDRVGEPPLSTQSCRLELAHCRAGESLHDRGKRRPHSRVEKG